MFFNKIIGQGVINLGYYWKYKHEKYNNVKNRLERWANSPRNRK